MTREDYIRYALTDYNIVIYEYYKEKFNHSKHKPFLDYHQFLKHAMFMGLIDLFYQVVSMHYESKLNLTRMFDKNQKFIGFI